MTQGWIKMVYCCRKLQTTNDNNERNIPLLQSMFESANVEEITAIHPPHEEFGEDIFLWRETSHGVFSISSAYHLLAALNHSPNDKIWAKIWKLHTPEWIKAFVWLMKHDGILTNNYLQRLSTRALWCDICTTKIEDILHVLRECSIATDVWRQLVAVEYCQVFFSLSLQDWI